MKNLTAYQVFAATLALAAFMFAVVVLTYVAMDKARAPSTASAFSRGTAEIDGDTLRVLGLKGERA